MSFFIFTLVLSCQYLLIAARAFPVFAIVNQCKDGEALFETMILTKSPFVNTLCIGDVFPLISHDIALSPILVCTAYAKSIGEAFFGNLIGKLSLLSGTIPHFEQWITGQDIGWKRVAIYDGRQIFQLLDQRDKNYVKCIYLVANSREEIMEWLLANENRMIHNNFDKRSQIIDWIPIEKNNRGKMNESFEIIRLLDYEIPKEEFFLFDANERGRFNPFVFDPKKKIKISEDKIKKGYFKINNYFKFINKFNQGWSWDFPIAVFQLGLEIFKFKRKYLLRCLYKRVNSGKIFLGWKVQLIIELSTKEKIENPFWNLSREEETILENLMQDAGFFNKEEYLNSNTAKKEYQRRFNFQNEIDSFYF